MAVLGVTEHRFLGFEDGSLATIDTAVGVAAIADLIDEIHPDTILTFGPDGMTFHTDHVTIGAWTTQAWDSAGRPGQLLYATTTHEHIAAYSAFYEEWGVYMTDERPLGHPAADLAVHHIMDGDLLDQKLAALAAMASQTAGAIATLDPDLWLATNREECFVDPTLHSVLSASSEATARLKQTVRRG